MARILCVLVLVAISLIATVQRTHGFPVENWAMRLEANEGTNVTNLQFYFHDTVSGGSPSAVKVAQSANTDKSLTLFGAIMMADDPLTEGPDPNSKLVGRAQGLYGSAGQNEIALIMAMNLGFTDGIYKGSSVSVLGKNQPMSPVREMPIVGGTGVFRLARGYAIAETYSMNIAGDAIVHYSVTIVH